MTTNFAPFTSEDRWRLFSPTFTSDEEEAACMAVRKEVYEVRGLTKPDFFDDIEILHFLRNEKHDVERTTEVFAAHLQWRMDNDIDTILDRYPGEIEHFEQIRAYWPGGTFGVDKEGDLFQVDRLGAIDARSIFANLKRDEMDRFHLWFQEEHQRLKREHFAKTGHQVYAVTYIMDLAGLGMRDFYRPGIQLIMDFLKLDMAQYPDGVKTINLINCPSIFSMGWKLFTPMLSDLILNKVRILGTDYQDALLEQIDADQLPRELGGCRPADGPLIPEGGIFGAPVASDDDKDMLEETVYRRSSFAVSVDVPIAGSTVIYHWRLTSGTDIVFGANFADARTPDSPNGLLPMVQHSDQRHMDAISISEPGKVEFVFDNTASILTSKTVKYLFTVLTPDQEATAQK